jgi:hypothetical protein
MGAIGGFSKAALGVYIDKEDLEKSFLTPMLLYSSYQAH